MDILRERQINNLYTRYAVNNTPSNHDFCMHVHDQYEIFLFVTGDAQYLVEGTTYQLRPFDVMIMRPSESHSTQILHPTRYERYVINFYPDLIKAVDSQQHLLNIFSDHPLGKNNQISTDEFSKKKIYQLFQSIVLCDGNDYHQKLKMNIHFFMLLDLLYDLYYNQKSSDFQTIAAQPATLSEQILSYVNSHLFDDISVPKLAKYFYISPSHFSRIFKQATGAAPWEYILLKRLTAAKEKINAGMSITQAATECGFSDYSSFYRAYVKIYGCSPRKDLITPLP